MRTIRIDIDGRTVWMHPAEYFAIVAAQEGCTPDEARARFTPSEFVRWEDVEE